MKCAFLLRGDDIFEEFFSFFLFWLENHLVLFSKTEVLEKEAHPLSTQFLLHFTRGRILCILPQTRTQTLSFFLSFFLSLVVEKERV